MRHVYFICGGGFTRVGSTGDIATRLGVHQQSCPFELRIVHAEPGGYNVERAVIELLADRHVRGEWFHGEIDADDAAALVDAARLRRREGVSAAEKWPRPNCECHGKPMSWAKGARYRGGGYWRCIARRTATV